MSNSNRNYAADFCIADEPIRGYDTSRGFTMIGDVKHYSEIEDWRFANADDVEQNPALVLGESKIYTNPMIRQFFFTPDQKKAYLDRAKKDIDPGCSLIAMEIYNTLGPPPEDAVGDNRLDPDPKQRTGEYLFVPSSGEKIPLNRLRALASSGQDRNGKQIYDDKTYVIEFDGPGVFTYTAPVEGADEGTLTFTPPKR